jgi:hypothetical protein
MFARVVALTAALAVSGCSFVLVDGPPARSSAALAEPGAPPPPSCTDSYVVPAIDGVVAMGAFLGFVYFAASDDDMKEVGMFVEGALATGFTVSALRGRGQVKRCRAAQQAFAPQQAFAAQQAFAPR